MCCFKRTELEEYAWETERERERERVLKGNVTNVMHVSLIRFLSLRFLSYLYWLCGTMNYSLLSLGFNPFVFFSKQIIFWRMI